MLQVIDHLFARPVMSVPQLSALLDVQFPVASRYVKRLEQDEVVVEITGKGRNRLYLARGIMQAIEDPIAPAGRSNEVPAPASNEMESPSAQGN